MTTRPNKPRAKKTPDQTVAVTRRPQPHGGALLVGGNPGNKGGQGAVPSELRRRLVGSFADRVGVIEQVADGVPIRRVRVSLAEVLRFAVCPKCGEELEKTASDPASMIEFEATESASARDRLAALDLAAKYGLGVKDELTVTSLDVQSRLGRLVDGLVRLLPPEFLAPVRQLMDEVWNDG